MAEQRISYTGERIDVGIDVHKETYTVTCLCQRQIVKTATVPADPARLAESLSRWFPGARLFSAYEAGFSGFVLHRALTTAGITNIVVNPASVAVAANDKRSNRTRELKVSEDHLLYRVNASPRHPSNSSSSALAPGGQQYRSPRQTSRTPRPAT